MAEFHLVPVDGGDPIHLPPGETMLGRGPFLGVSDKRVSRCHGLLENLNGQLRLKPTHLNPCFVQSSLSDEPRPLQKDSWFLLRHGDLFSLLPGQFIYKVVAVGGEDRTPRNSQMFEEEEDELPVFPALGFGQNRGPSPPHGEPTSATPSIQDEADCQNTGLTQGVSAHPEDVEQDHSNDTPPVNKKRVLPAWMMVAAAAAPMRPSFTLKAEKRSRAPAAAADQIPELRQDEEEEVMPSKKSKKMSDEEAAQSKADVPSSRVTVRHQSGPNRSEVSDETDSFTMEVEEEGNGNVSKPEKQSKPDRPKTKPAQSVGSNGSSVSAPTPSKPRLRTPCPYGKDCYRKNPNHFQECSHPGDTDYKEEEETEEEDRPECPYGTDCYRKNPVHRKEFKHTKKPARPTRTASRKPDEEEDEEGHDNSFIDDDSEDVGDDSDYVPPDSDDSGKEDIRRLQEEAKVFLKKRR